MFGRNIRQIINLELYYNKQINIDKEYQRLQLRQVAFNYKIKERINLQIILIPWIYWKNIPIFRWGKSISLGEAYS